MNKVIFILSCILGLGLVLPGCTALQKRHAPPLKVGVTADYPSL